MKTPFISHYLSDLKKAVETAQCLWEQTEPLSLDAAIEKVLDMLFYCSKNGKKIYAVGNGGSACIVGHLQCDLVKACEIPCYVFQDIGLLTAYSNDEGYHVAYSQQLKKWAEEGDLLIAISSSGESANILNAAACASKMGMKTITLSGFSQKNPLRSHGTLDIYIPQKSYGLVELSHAILCHMITDAYLQKHPFSQENLAFERLSQT